ncbi:MAG: hypothetical protein IJB86_06110, partial [Clostridia bacterium]|nr:hypothetical protein [Clostridia bacterium]
HLKCNRLRAVGHFFDVAILTYGKEKNVRMCVKYCISDIWNCLIKKYTLIQKDSSTSHRDDTVNSRVIPNVCEESLKLLNYKSISILLTEPLLRQGIRMTPESSRDPNVS